MTDEANIAEAELISLIEDGIKSITPCEAEDESSYTILDAIADALGDKDIKRASEMVGDHAAYIATAILAAGYRKRSDVLEEKLTADFTKALPGGVLDDSTFEQIEDALDAIEAPCTDSTGKWLTLPERIRNIKDKP